MTPHADHGEESYRGRERLAGRVAVITGGDSGIGRAVAIAYAREGADILISYLNEQEDADARETARHVEAAGRCCALVPGDIAEAAHCRAIIERAVNELGRIDILVNNAAFQRTYGSLEDIPDEEWSYTFRTNIEMV
jgi:NAD(P)-dependent dehydrogenase (short-subunit alcohol dehydrogenase family)